MAIYVTSDAHGHVRALDQALELASPGADDEIYVLGDMIDRGPDPVGVIRLVRSLGAHVLRGNHEDMMLDVLGAGSRDGVDAFTWALNGGHATLAGLDAMDEDEYRDTVAWVRELPLFAVVECAGRLWILVHAGLDTLEARGYLATAGVDVTDGRGAAAADAKLLTKMLEAQSRENLVWVRDAFWGGPTGFVGEDGSGPIVVAGHTPSIFIDHFARDVEPPSDDDGDMGRIVRVGACASTGGVPDKIDIDCSAAAGAGQGRVGVMRLDDGQVWYATIKAGE